MKHYIRISDRPRFVGHWLKNTALFEYGSPRLVIDFLFSLHLYVLNYLLSVILFTESLFNGPPVAQAWPAGVRRRVIEWLFNVSDRHWVTSWRRCVRNLPWPHPNYCPGIILEGLRKITLTSVRIAEVLKSEAWAYDVVTVPTRRRCFFWKTPQHSKHAWSFLYAICSLISQILNGVGGLDWLPPLVDAERGRRL
jgi:hypothetical protein